MFRFRNWTQELIVLRGMKERVVYTQAKDLSLRETHISTGTLPTQPRFRGGKVIHSMFLKFARFDRIRKYRE
jgi:hypothetical protein